MRDVTRGCDGCQFEAASRFALRAVKSLNERLKGWKAERLKGWKAEKAGRLKG
jgi:hypothetical protein